MDRDNLRAKLEDVHTLPVKRRVEEYEELLKDVDLKAVEKFKPKQGGKLIVIEVRRRIEVLRKICDNLRIDETAEKAKKLLQKFE